ncbi:MAG: glycerol-3-phosphate 1-O-acyltransferase PlsY [Candidatus Dormibacteraeota bacterium]|nr:glycerol-3-phosphate 1-O-acyltransferase PlsY [Candidatus Dormibacteraeota bacterium]
MSGLVSDVGATAAGYAIGSIPFGLLLGHATRGLDVRETGSGSMGSTNVLRVAGPAAAAATFALDVGKGTAAVLCARSLGAEPAGQVGAGLAAMVGHSWPVFAGFRGGKSVATAFGGLLAVSPEASAWAVAGGLSALLGTRIVSIGSMVAAASATIGAGVSAARGGARAPLVFAGLASALIAIRHTDNLRRLARGVEPRVSLSRRAR